MTKLLRRALAALALLVVSSNAAALTYAESWAACEAYIAAAPSQCTGLGCGSPPAQYTYKCEENTVEVTAKRMTTPPGTSWGNLQSWRWSGGKTCPAGSVPKAGGGCRPDCSIQQETTSGYMPPNGSVQCRNGCDVAYYYNGDGTSTGSRTGDQCDVPPSTPDCSRLGPGYYWHPNLNACVPIKPEDCESGVTPKEGVCEKPEQCPSGMHTDQNGLCAPDNTECPAGQIKSPEGSCLPGDGQCAVGEVRRPNGTCGKDADGDGQADDDDDNPDNDSEKGEFSGGDTCTTPPSCSGDAIMCGQARIQWRIDCNTRRNNNITGGSCDAVPVCTGEKCNAMEYAQLLQQWRTSCAVQKLAAASGTDPGGSPGDANGNGQPDWTENPGDGTGQNLGDAGSPDGVVKEGEEHGADGLDITGLGFPRTCPQIPTVSVMGHSISMDTTVFCDWLKLGGQFVLIAAALLSLRIMASGGAA